MYTKISNPEIVVYDGETKELIGKAKFMLSPSTENKLLQLVNYNIKPSSLLLLNVILYEPAEGYSIPLPYYQYMREGKITALFTEADTKRQVPIEIAIKYKTRAHGANPAMPNYYDSVVFSDIEVVSVEGKY
ncbi:MAG TPA: hypothetical protein DIC60_02125 [Lachnospiraceae bacterium]|nr:hypothetical protein [Lachnospiraceae bacterium]